MAGAASRWIAGWPQSPSYRLARAQAAYDGRDWTKAAELSRQVLQADHDSVPALLLYARSQARVDRHAAAAAIYRRLGQDRMHAEDFFLEGLAKVRSGDVESALELWEKGAKAGPENAELLDHLTRLASASQRLDLAASHALMLARQPGWEARAQLLLGQIRALVDDPVGAVDALRAGLALDPEAKGAVQGANHYRRLLARSLLQLGRPAEAKAVLEAIAGAEGKTGVDAEAEWLLSRAYLQEGQIAAATAALDRGGSYRALNPLVPEPSPYVGAARCAPVTATWRGRILSTGTPIPFTGVPSSWSCPSPIVPCPTRSIPRSRTRLRGNDGIKVETHIGELISRVIVEYAFGPRDGYVTMVGRDDEKIYRALRLSSYHTPEGIAWGQTGIDVGESELQKNVRGQPVSVRDGVVRCLYCHVTQSRDFRDPPPAEGTSPASADLAIGCERCHGPGKNHVLAIEADFSDRAIVNTGGKHAVTINKQCSDCHIVGPLAQIAAAPADPSYLRSPGATLAASRCFTESKGALHCLTCHDAHFDADRSAGFQEAKCLACHSGREAPAAASAVQGAAALAKPAVSASVCPVNAKTGCLECHMPKIERPLLHMSLTDHYIRVRSDKPGRSDAAGKDPRGTSTKR